jgi:hypothetical protein
MATREILRAEWVLFFDQFSRDHLKETATLEIVGKELGDQVVVDTQQFRGISADEKDRENRITILVGADESAEHAVMNPSVVLMKDAEGDAGPALEIRGDDDTATLLTFQKPVRPAETVSGS